ncbi:hypothetical protein ON010_g1940 [Phytophthora cinnamomi]|nr:hypothetical protein ON010_g1940 [Phytophthora cinnamomi]
MAEARYRLQHRHVDAGEDGSPRHPYGRVRAVSSMGQAGQDVKTYGGWQHLRQLHPRALRDRRQVPVSLSTKWSFHETAGLRFGEAQALRLQDRVLGGPPGLAVDGSDRSPGSCSDVTMMLDRLSVHRQMLRNDGTSTPEIGDEPTKFPEMWAVLVDKGYQGVGRVFRTIQPKKKPRGGTLDRNALAPNKAVSAD